MKAFSSRFDFSWRRFHHFNSILPTIRFCFHINHSRGLSVTPGVCWSPWGPVGHPRVRGKVPLTPNGTHRGTSKGTSKVAWWLLKGDRHEGKISYMKAKNYLHEGIFIAFRFFMKAFSSLQFYFAFMGNFVGDQHEGKIELKGWKPLHEKSKSDENAFM